MQKKLYYSEVLLNGCMNENDAKEWKKLSRAFYEVGSKLFYEIKDIINVRMVEDEMKYGRDLYIGKSGFNEYKVNIMIFNFLHSIELLLKAIHMKYNIAYNNKSHNLVSLSNDINKKVGREIIKVELINNIKIVSKHSSREFCYLENKNRQLSFKDECVELEMYKEIIDEILKTLFKYI